VNFRIPFLVWRAAIRTHSGGVARFFKQIGK
jgi:hypothetical protein